MTIVLTQVQAELRRKCFDLSKEIKYKVFQSLQKGDKYEGVVEATFTLLNTFGVFLDYSGKNIVKAIINDVSLTEDQIEQSWINGHFQLEKFVKLGENKLSVFFQSEYNTDGDGLQSVINAQGRQYLYCQTEPYAQNRVFPCFDQPDLKGELTYSFAHPFDWKVVSNTFEDKQFKYSEIQNQSDLTNLPSINILSIHQESIITIFKETLALSSYLYCFVAGEYRYIEYIDVAKDYNYPLRIYYDEELTDYVKDQSTYIFAYIVQCLKFYKSFFQIDAPWHKYDTVICPEFTVGAMEYPGVITYSDLLIFRTPNPTPNQVSRMGHVIVHELAHQWFGNLVTMKWWNDLWLNESFADFMCYLCQSEIDQFIPRETTDSWCAMNIRKSWGYQEDQSITTHPIAAEVENTSVANSIFDGITYSKGAAVLKQLYFVIGRETFSNGLKNYFQKFQFGNATLEDFLNEMQNVSKDNKDEKNLIEFNKQWIEKEGPNVLSVQWQSEQKNQQTIKIEQTNYHNNLTTLRFHKIKVGWFGDNGEIIKSDDVLVQDKHITEITTDCGNAKACLLNFEDWSFVMVQLDEVSKKWFLENLNKVNDQLSLLLILRSFMDMVQSGSLLPHQFIQSIISQDVLKSYIKNALIVQTVSDYLLSALKYLPTKYVGEQSDKVFDYLKQFLSESPSESITQTLLGSLISSGSTVRSIDHLRALWIDCVPMKTSLTLEHEWRILVRIYSSNFYSESQKQQFRDSLFNKDKSQLNTLYSLVLDAMTDNKEDLDKIFNEYISANRTMSHTKLSYSLTGFFNSLSPKVNRDEYIVKFFNSLPSILNEQPLQIGKVLILSGIPSYMSIAQQIEQLKKVQGQIDPELKFHIRNIEKQIQQLLKIHSVHQKYAIQKQ